MGVSCKLAIGFPVGDFLTEVLHVFTQEEANGPVKLMTLGLAQQGSHQEKAYQGMRDQRVKFIDLVKKTLQAAPPDMLKSLKRKSTANLKTWQRAPVDTTSTEDSTARSADAVISKDIQANQHTKGDSFFRRTPALCGCMGESP